MRLALIFVTGLSLFADANFLFSGDSNTYGETFVSSTQTYPYVCGTLSRFAGLGTVRNLGVNARQTPALISTYTDEIHPYSPGVTGIPGYLFILIGTNDSIGGTSIEDTTASMSTLWALAKADGFALTVLTVPPFDQSAPVEAKRQAINTYIREHTAEFDRLVDLDLVFSDPNDLTYYNADGVHFTVAGYALIAAAVNQSMGGRPRMSGNARITGTAGYQ